MSNYLLSMFAATLFATQAVPTKPATPKAAVKPLVTLTGCVKPDAATPGAYTFSQTGTGTTYRLSGLEAQKDEGKRGELVVGSGSRRVTIRGGLVPSPNVAAQAGSLDQVKATITGMPEGANTKTPDPSLPEFRATHVQSGTGSCP